MTLKLPNFLIVGAAKSGTSTLIGYLRRHPQIFMANSEIHFFDLDENFNRGLGWYSNFFAKAKGEIAIGEKTPGYTYHSFAPQASLRIHQHFPEMKLIWIFRDPVERVYSHLWMVMRGRPELLQEPMDPKRVQRNLDHGRYVNLLKHYLIRSTNN